MTTPESDGTSSPASTTPPSGGHRGEEPGPLLTDHAFLVLIGMAMIALVVGGLTYLSAGNPAAAVLAGLMAGGVSGPVLHKLVGR